MTQICLYQNARQDVRYVYGHPVKFEARLAAEREKDKAAAIAAQRKENNQ